MRITKIYWKRFASPVSLATGLLLGAFAMLLHSFGITETELRNIGFEVVKLSRGVARLTFE